MPVRDEELTYVKGHTVEVGPHFLPLHFLINDDVGEYLEYMRRLIYQGTILTSDPSMNKAEWVPVCGCIGTLPLQSRSA